jgi:hypothetical protein
MDRMKEPSGGVAAKFAGNAFEPPGKSTLAIYENEIPPFVERELETLYECIYCTLARLSIYDVLTNVSTYVVRRGARVSTLFLFRLVNDEIQVLNQQIAVSEEEIRAFSDTMFSRYRSARIISFYAIDTRLHRLPFPFQTYVALHENVIFPPPSAEEYMGSMSANFRAILRRAERRIQKQFPSFRFDVVCKTQVSEALVREIIRMAGARMAVKHRAAYVGEEHLGNLMRLIRTHGYVVVAAVDGKVCGGSVWYSVGRRNFLHIIAHDPEYDHYHIGNQTLLMGVLYWIARGGRECWLMGGSGDHKSKFVAVSKSLESVVVYRSRSAMLFHLRRAAGGATTRLMHRVRHEIRNRAGRAGPAARLFAMLLTCGRSLKRLGMAIA